MASPSPPGSSTPSSAPVEDAVDNEDMTTDLPLTMAASVILDQLPRDAHEALQNAGELPQAKVTIRLSPLPNTPQLRQPRFKCSSSQRFEAIVRFVRKKLSLGDHESVFCYINQVFAPGLDEGVGDLWRCFRVNDELVVSYSITQAFG